MLDLPTQEGWKAELTWVAGYIVYIVHLFADSHQSKYSITTDQKLNPRLLIVSPTPFRYATELPFTFYHGLSGRPHKNTILLTNSSIHDKIDVTPVLNGVGFRHVEILDSVE